MNEVKHISELDNIGNGKSCLLVGGGHSVENFDFSPFVNDYIICANNHKSNVADMIIYFDHDMNKHFENIRVSDNTVMVGYKYKKINNTNDRTDYYYTYDDIVFGDTGFHMLQFADKLFKFSEISLIGYDYYTEKESYHYDEVKSDTKKMDNFIGHSIGNVLKRYEDMAWDNEIINFSKKSALNCFKKPNYVET